MEHGVLIPMPKTIKQSSKVLSGLALTEVADDSPFVQGQPVILASPPPAVPAMTITAATEYGHLATQAIQKALSELYEIDGVLVLPSEGGEWVDIVRVAVAQALQDGYACLKAGVPVAIKGTAEAVTFDQPKPSTSRTPTPKIKKAE